MTSAPWPTVEQILALGTAKTLIAPPEFEDENGHVNVVHYYSTHMTGSDDFFLQLGFDENYRERTGHSVFSVEHHIKFHDETMVGDEISIHLRILGMGPKVIHGQSILLNRTRGTVANTLEFIELHVDLTSRRTIEMPPELATGLHDLAEAHRALAWELPLAGSLGIR